MNFKSEYLPEVTIVIVDLSGFVSIDRSNTLSVPPNLPRLIQLSIEEFGGKVLQKPGDGCVAMFPAIEALSAVRAVQAIESSLQHSTLRVCAGIAIGAAIVGSVQQTRPSAITGAAYKSAERLQRHSRRSKRSIVVCKKTAEILAAEVAVELVDLMPEEDGMPEHAFAIV